MFCSEGEQTQVFKVAVGIYARKGVYSFIPPFLGQIEEEEGGDCSIPLSRYKIREEEFHFIFLVREKVGM